MSHRDSLKLHLPLGGLECIYDYIQVPSQLRRQESVRDRRLKIRPPIMT